MTLDPHWIALMVGIALTSGSQILLRSGARAKASVVQSAMNRKVVSGYILFVFVTVLNVYAMQLIPLKMVTAWTSIGYVLTPVLSRGILKESLTLNNMVGGFVIVLGVILFSFGEMS